MREERTYKITCDECGYSEVVPSSRLAYEEVKTCPSCRKGKMWWVPPSEEARRREVGKEERVISPLWIIIPIGLGLALAAAIGIIYARKPTLSSARMTKTEAQRVAAQLGLHYDGIQEGIGHQFTDREVTGTTFYGNTPSEVKARLVEKRKLFKRLGG